MWLGAVNPELIEEYKNRYLSSIPRQKQYFTTAEVRDLLKCGIYQLSSNLIGRLHFPVHYIGARRIYDKTEVAQWLASQLGNAWLEHRLRKRYIKADDYNAIVDFIKEYEE